MNKEIKPVRVYQLQMTDGYTSRDYGTFSTLRAAVTAKDIMHFRDHVVIHSMWAVTLPDGKTYLLKSFDSSPMTVDLDDVEVGKKAELVASVREKLSKEEFEAVMGM